MRKDRNLLRYVIYLITNLANGKHYVGKTVQSMKARWGGHLSSARLGRGAYLGAAIRKYGEDNFSIVPLITVLDTDAQLKEQEKFWIRVFRSNDPRYGYNLTEGGDGAAGIVMSAETRRRHSEGLKGNQNRKGHRLSEEHRRKISEAQKGKKRKPLSVEHRRKIGEAQKDRKPSIETRRKMSKSLKGRMVSAEHRRKISEALKGIPKSPEACRKLSEARKNLSTETRRKQSEAMRGVYPPQLRAHNERRSAKARNNPNEQSLLPFAAPALHASSL